MIRMTILYTIIGFLCLYSFRDWYKALCALILLVAFVKHPDIPKSLMGIQGLSVWNILLVFVCIGCALKWKEEGLKWDMPRNVTIMVSLFVVMFVIAYARFIVDLEGMEEYNRIARKNMDSVLGLTSEHLINPLKWLAPAVLLFIGCRSEKRLRQGLYAVLGFYLLLALQIIRWMPLNELAGGENFAERALRVLTREIGYHRVDLSMMLGGAFWAFVAARENVKSALARMTFPVLIATTFLGQALTGGRAGYVTWAGVGLVMAWLKWRRYLILAPIGAAMLILFVPAVQDRLMEGFSEDSIDDRRHELEAEWLGETDADLYTVTAGRVIAWPFVVEKIAERPWIGYGRRAMQREGIATQLLTDYGESFPHPHNAYLEVTLDNGLIGLAITLMMFFHFGIYSMQMLVDKSSKEAMAVGGVAFALMLALAAAAIGSQTFYPREGTVGMWCAIGLMLRVRVMLQQRNAANGSSAMPVATIT